MYSIDGYVLTGGHHLCCPLCCYLSQKSASLSNGFKLTFYEDDILAFLLNGSSIP